MKTKGVSVIMVLALFTLALGCQSLQIPEERRGAVTGAGVGAATGTAAGAILGRSAESAILGGLIGGLVGGVIGHYSYDQRRSRQDTLAQYDYRSGAGTVINIEEAAANPSTVRPGENVDLRLTYAVLTPNPETEVNITEIREIRFNGELVGQPEVRVRRTGGTYTSSIPIRLPRSARAGEYQVTTIVQSDVGRDTEQTTFRVSGLG